MSQQNLLQNVYLFKELTPVELEKIGSVCQVTSFVPGDEIFSEGDAATCLYVIKYGSVRIKQKGVTHDGLDVANLGTGSHFGEMAFLDSEKRSATVSVVEKTEIVQINYKDLQTILDGNLAMAVKVYRALAHFLCGRLRLTTHDLSFAREKNLRHF